MKRYLLFILTLMMVSIGDSLCFKANIGVSPYDDYYGEADQEFRFSLIINSDTLDQSFRLG